MIRFLLIFSVLSTSLAYASFEQLKEGYDQGKYNNFLEENAFLSKSWLEKGYFNEYIQNRNNTIHLTMQKYRLAKEAQKKHKAKLDKLEKNKNRMLSSFVENYPHLRISRMVRNILNYSRLSEIHRDALDYMVFLEFGVVDISQDPAAYRIQQLMFDYTLRSIVVTSLLIDGKIGTALAHNYQAILELDKERALRELCEKTPDSYAARKCLEAMDVAAAMIPVAYDKKYLGDMIVGMRPPENEVEKKVCHILRETHSKKMQLMSQN